MKYVLWAMLLASACGVDFDPGYRVTTPRLLAASVDAPYAAPGQTVHIETLGYAPSAPLTWGFATCVDPPGFTVQTCLAAVDPASVVLTDEPRTDVLVPADTIERVPIAARATAGLGVLVAACPGDLSVDPTRGFICTDASGRALDGSEWVLGVKRVFARTVDKNQDPTLDGLTWDGQPWPEDLVVDADPCDTSGNTYDDCPSGLRHHVVADVSATSVEQGVDSFGDAFHEDVVVQFYATEGIFEHAVRVATAPDTGWVARRAASGQTVTVWVVIRDDRGGVSWTTRHVAVH